MEKGVPPLLRQRVWPLLLGNALKLTPEAFELFWARAQAGAGSLAGLPGKEATVRLIDEDLKRTFVALGFFGRGEPLHDVMRKLLLTYAFYRPDIGYVQGMSFLAGILAVHIWDEALCFQCLANLLGSEHLYAFYSLKVGFPRRADAQPAFIQRYYEVFDAIFKAANPTLFAFFQVTLRSSSLSRRATTSAPISSSSSGCSRSSRSAFPSTSLRAFGTRSSSRERASSSAPLSPF